MAPASQASTEATVDDVPAGPYSSRNVVSLQTVATTLLAPNFSSLRSWGNRAPRAGSVAASPGMREILRAGLRVTRAPSREPSPCVQVVDDAALSADA
jgi:hypothetical protein